MGANFNPNYRGYCSIDYAATQLQNTFYYSVHFGINTLTCKKEATSIAEKVANFAVFTFSIIAATAMIACTSILYVAGGILRSFSYATINYDNLSERPGDLADETLTKIDVITDTHITKLLGYYDEVFGAEYQASLEKQFHMMLEKIKNSDKLKTSERYLVAIHKALYVSRSAIAKKEQIFTSLYYTSRFSEDSWNTKIKDLYNSLNTPHININEQNLSEPASKALEEGFNSTLPLALRAQVQQMLTNIKNKSDGIAPGCPDTINRIVQQTSTYLNATVEVFEQKEVPFEKKQRVLTLLQEASIECPPTWYENARDGYCVLHNVESAEALVKTYVQEYKENLLKEIFQIDLDLSMWHELTSARLLIGDEMGLASGNFDHNCTAYMFNNCDSLESLLETMEAELRRLKNENHHDLAMISKTEHSVEKIKKLIEDSTEEDLEKFNSSLKHIFLAIVSLMSSYSRWAFLCKFRDVNRLIDALTVAINFRDYNPKFHDFFIKIEKQKGQIADEEIADYVASEYFDEEYKITKFGAQTLLKELNIINVYG